MSFGLEQAFDLAFVIQHDRLGRGNARQARHGHDLTADRNNEPGTRRQDREQSASFLTAIESYRQTNTTAPDAERQEMRLGKRIWRRLVDKKSITQRQAQFLWMITPELLELARRTEEHNGLSAFAPLVAE